MEILSGKNSPRVPVKSRDMGRLSVSFQKGSTMVLLEDRSQIMEDAVSFVSLDICDQ